MSKLEWDKPLERHYEAGIDHGVLYLPNPQGEYDNGVAWNGLISIDEDFGGDATQPSYFDGVKFLDSYPNGDYVASLTAFTYPDEFLEFEGMVGLGNGLMADDQNSRVFGLSYRTLIGQGPLGIQHYEIHLLYNLTAEEASHDYQNGSNPSEPLNFSWSIVSIPEKASPYKPTAHLILNSEYLNSEILKTLEDVLYGTEDEQPRLPSLSDLIDIVLRWGPKMIVAAPVTGLAPLVPGVGDLTEVNIPGIYFALPTTKLVKSEFNGFYRLEEAQ